MADEDDYNSDSSGSTVLLIDFINKPKKVDAKRRRLSKLNNSSLTGEYEEQSTAPDVASANKITDGSPKLKNEFNRDQVICIDSDEETHEKENNDAVNTVVHDGINYTKGNITEYPELKPGRIHARRATSNIFEYSERCINLLHGQGGNKQERNNILRPSVINARRATTGLEEKCFVSEKINVSEMCNNMISSCDTVNASLKQRSEVKDQFDSSVFLNKNANKQFKNGDETPSEPKRIRINTDSISDDKHEKATENRHKTNDDHAAQNTFSMPLKINTPQVLDKQVFSKSKGKIVSSEVKFGQFKSNLLDMQKTGEDCDNQETNKCSDKQKPFNKTSKTPNEKNICTKPYAQDTTSVNDDEVRNELVETIKAQGKQEKNHALISERKIRNAHEISESSEILEAEVPSERKDTGESKDVEETQMRSNVHNDQEIEKYPDTKLINDKSASQSAKQIQGEQGTKHLAEKKSDNQIERKESKQKVSTANKGHILKFQVGFFTFVKDFIKSLNPQFAILLQNVIKKLITDAKSGKVLTDITFNCPQCNHESTYSTNLLHDTEDNEDIPKADESQKCALCKVLKKLHITYMNRYLKEAAAKNKISKSVENPLPLIATNDQPAGKQKSTALELQSNIHAVDNADMVSTSSVAILSNDPYNPKSVSKEMFKQNTSTTNEIYTNDNTSAINDLASTQKRKIIGQTNDAKCRKLGMGQDHVYNNNLTHIVTSLPKDDTAVSNSDSNLTTCIMVPSIKNQRNTNKKAVVGDDNTKKIVVLSMQVLTPGRESGHENKEYSGSVEKKHVNINDKIQENRELSRTRTLMDNLAKESDAIYPKDDTISEKNKVTGSTHEISTSCINPDLGVQSNVTYNNVTENVDKDLTSKNTPNTFNEKVVISSSHKEDICDEIERNDDSNKTSKSGDNKAIYATSERPVVVEKLNTDTQRHNSEENNTINKTEKTLEKLYENLKKNANAKDKGDEKVKSQHENNTGTPLSAPMKKTKPTKSLNTQPRSTNIRKVDLYICPTCTCTYSYPLKFLSHMREKHHSNLTKIPEQCIKRQCVFCNTVLSKNQYNRHMKQYHHDMFTKIVSTNETGGNNNHNEKKSTLNNSHSRNNQTFKESKYQYHCSICDEILSTIGAATRHKKQKHSNFGCQQIFNKVMVKDNDTRTHGASKDDEIDESTVEYKTHVQSSEHKDNYGNDASTELTTNSNAIIKDDAKLMEMECDKHDHAGDSGDNAAAVSVLKSVSNRRTSSDEAAYDKGSCHSKQNSSNSKHKNMNQDNESLQASKKCEPSNPITEGNVGNCKEQESTFNNIKSRKYIAECLLCKEIFTSVSASRKHREEQHRALSGVSLFKRIASDANSLCERDLNRKVTKQTKENSSPLSADGVKNTDETSEDEVLKPPESALKNKKERIRKLFGEDNNPTMQNKVNVKSNVNEAKSSIVQTTENNERDVVSKPNNGAEDETVKVSKNTAEIKETRATTFIGTEHETAVLDKKNYRDQQPKNKQNVVVSFATVTENNKRECINNNGTQQIANKEESMQVDQLLLDNNVTSARNNCDQKASTGNVKSPSDKTDEKTTENKISKDISSNKTDLKKTNSDQCREKNSVAGDKPIDSKELNNEKDLLNNFHDDDRTEIDQINRLLELYEEERNENINNTDQVEESEAAVNVQVNNSPNPSAEAKTCLENIKITNVTSIADKIFIYVCEECQYATDDYDNAIKHCQNHYNETENPIAYCRVCDLKYDVSCFAKHEITHDKYLRSIKIKFSHSWLFSNWQAVFNDMPLNDVEDVQMKSIYKTFCVKMTVKEEGSWQTALYQCVTCKTCVPSNEIERHVKGKCNHRNYPCGICKNKFLTYEMRTHHEIYHAQDESKPFKIITFNEHNDKSFNLKLFQARAEQSKQKQQQTNGKEIVDIIKCLCGLSLTSWQKFKFHFVECKGETNKGIECPKCIVKLKFLKEDLSDHLVHHDGVNYEFRVRRITFEEENITEDNSEHDTLSNISDTNPYDDLNIKKEMKKEEISTQSTIRNTQNSQFDFDGDDLEVKRELLKSEVSSQEKTEDLEKSFNLTPVEDLDWDVEFIE